MRLSEQLQTAALQCSEEASAQQRDRASDLICGAWAADLASRLLIHWKPDLLSTAMAPPIQLAAFPGVGMASSGADALARTDLDNTLKAFIEKAVNLSGILEKIGLAAFWLGRPQDGAALLNGSATLAHGPWNGAMAEAAAWQLFGFTERANETLRCATRTLLPNVGRTAAVTGSGPWQRVESGPTAPLA